MRLALLALLLVPLVAASAPAQRSAQPLEQALEQARREEAAAAAETARLEKAAAAAQGEAARLDAQQKAAAQALEQAEARITAAEAQYRLASARSVAYRQRLAEEERPVSSLLAGLATMARQPPILTLADEKGPDELVRVSVLLDATLPTIRARTRALTAQLAIGERLQASASAARADLVRSRQMLYDKQARFARLEREAFDRSLATGGQALSAGDVAISATEQVERLKSEQARRISAEQTGRLLALEPPMPVRQRAPAAADAPFPYMLPVRAPLTQGLGAVDESGVRSRGIVLASPRGAAVIAPADGIVRYSGPFRDYDGLVVIDHGGGWLSAVVNVASPLKVGDRVGYGAPLGRALGPLQVQLSRSGQLFSPALIAGSSQSLSKGSKGS